MHQKSQLQAIEDIRKGESISGKEAIDICAKKSSELIRLEKERKNLEKEKESEEIDRVERIKTVQRRIDELGGDMILKISLIFWQLFLVDPDYVPDATASIQQVITPSKGTTTTIEGPDFSLAIRKPIAVVQHLLPSTPHKELSAAPDIQSDKTESLEKRKRGENIDDDIKLEFLRAWIQYSEAPFGVSIRKHKSTIAKHTIEKLMK